MTRQRFSNDIGRAHDGVSSSANGGSSVHIASAEYRISTSKMELIAKHTLQDEVTFELIASIIVGVCPDESQQFTPLRVILQVENGEIWSQKKVRLL